MLELVLQKLIAIQNDTSFYSINYILSKELRMHYTFLGADILGLNCQYDYKTCIKTIKMMKEGLVKAGITEKYLMLQPVGFHCQDVENKTYGYSELPEYPFGK